MNNLKGVVTNLGDEQALQDECYQIHLEKYIQLEESNKQLTQSNKELS